MDSCCDTNSGRVSARATGACPGCGAVGRVVGDETVRSIVKPSLTAALLGAERRFCRTPTCDVLYYDEEGQRVDKSAATVRVGLKESADPLPLCYCFGFERADVREEVDATGDCTIPARITAHIRERRCACERKNPSGACCLGEVNQAVRDEKAARGLAPSPHK